LKELFRASGGDCGGTSVDNAFYEMFVKLVGAPLLNAMKREDPGSYLDIFREFETVKRTVYTDKEGKSKIARRILCCLGLFCSQKIHQLGRSFSNLILSSSLKRQKLAQ
jgi:hypothetical protein